MNHSEMKIGQRVFFGRTHGESTLGEVVKVNPTRVKVRQLEARGTMRAYPVGTVWTVPASLCAPADAGTTPVEKPAPVPVAKRPYLVNVFTGKRTYGRPGEDPEMIYNRLANRY